MISKEKVTVKWSNKEKDWVSKFPEWENRNGKITGNAFFTMIQEFEKFIGKDLRGYLSSGGFDPDTFTISVNAKVKRESTSNAY
jgi:hypothetical protein